MDKEHIKTIGRELTAEYLRDREHIETIGRELKGKEFDVLLQAYVRESWSKDQQSDEPTGEYSDYIEGYIEHMKEVVWEVWE